MESAQTTYSKLIRNNWKQWKLKELTRKWNNKDDNYI